MIRTAFAMSVLAVTTPWYGAQVLTHTALRSRRRKEVCSRCQIRWCRGVLRACGVKVEVRGVERLAHPGGQIIVANHASWLDVPALAGYLPVETCFIAKKELAHVPIFGPSFRACGHIPIDREDRDAAIVSLQEAGRGIREERKSVVVFPEGTRTSTGELQPFKRGAFVLAIQAGVPVVPVGIRGSRRALPKGSLRVRPGTISVVVGEPIETESYRVEDREALAQRARASVVGLLETRPAE